MILMTAGTLHPDDASALRSAGHRRLVRTHLHALCGHIAVRVAIGTAGMKQYPARFEE